MNDFERKSLDNDIAELFKWIQWSRNHPVDSINIGFADCGKYAFKIIKELQRDQSQLRRQLFIAKKTLYELANYKSERKEAITAIMNEMADKAFKALNELDKG